MRVEEGRGACPCWRWWLLNMVVGTSQHRGAWETTGSNTRRGYPNVGGCLLVGGGRGGSIH